MESFTSNLSKLPTGSVTTGVSETGKLQWIGLPVMDWSGGQGVTPLTSLYLAYGSGKLPYISSLMMKQAGI